MKKIYSLALIILSLFSCVLFSACENKYDDLKMKFYSDNGEVIEELMFVIDSSKPTDKKRIGVKFSGIDKEDVGQVVIYSLPNELVTVSNYKYDGNMCYVDISPNMSNMENGKLVVSHLASGKKNNISLKVDQKSNNLKVVNSNYVISIPEEETVTHTVDFSKLISLLPVGSTDAVYFKIASSIPSGVEPIALKDVEGYSDVYTGFEVSGSVDDSLTIPYVTIYPVTYMKGYEDDPNHSKDKYEAKIITIYFTHVLNESNVNVSSDETLNLDNIQLIANDNKLNSYKLKLKVGEKYLNETLYANLYEINIILADASKVSALLDGNNDIILKANVYTENFVDVQIILTPKGYVGEIYNVEKVVKVKGDVKPDKIKITKNGKELLTSDKPSIFDYYEEGNSLGSLFYFKAVSNSGLEVHETLSKMQIMVSPDILCEDNCVGEKPANLANRLYVLEIHNSDEYLKFAYDKNEGMMISEPIISSNRIYIKYNAGKGETESKDFGIKVRTIKDETIPEHWATVEVAERTLSFDRQTGVKSMVLEAGSFVPDGNKGVYDIIKDKENPRYIYLDRLEGLDNDKVYTKFINVANTKVLSVDGESITLATFEVAIHPLGDVLNPLKICNRVANVDIGEDKIHGETEFVYNFNKNTDEDVVGLVFRKDTDIGDYEVIFSQEGIKKASVIVRVYESLKGIDAGFVSFETNKKAFKNSQKTDDIVYTYADYTADYIVASEQKLGISLDLKDSVLNSNIVAEYVFNYTIGATFDASVEDKTNTYFNKVHDDNSFNYAMLDFVKGTYDDKDTADSTDDIKNYIFLTITVKTKKYDNIVTESVELDDTNKVTIVFYIYEEIKDEDISINHISMTRYMSDYLGKYNEQEAEATLRITMDDNLWNYVTGVEKVSWNIDNNGENVIDEKIGNDYKLKFRKSPASSSGYSRKVKAYIEQFGNVFEFQCVFNVENPIITERLIIDSPVKMYDDVDQNYYINLKNGGSYTVEARNVSSKGKVSHEGIIIQVADEYGSAYSARDYFDINQETSTITVKKVDNNYKFKLIIFAKDALKYIASSDLSGYNSPSSFLLDGEGINEGLYKNAYFVINIELSDGTAGNPYLITNADEFWEIDDTEAFKTAHYKLMTSISLDNTTDTNSKSIAGFAGTITTPVKTTDKNGNPTSYYIYTVDGIVLDEYVKTLFIGFAETGKIENIQFVIKFNYNINEKNLTEVYLGLFDKNKGTLKDVSVQVEGTAVLNDTTSATYYIGALAGENSGLISYTSGIAVAGEMGTITNPLSGNSTVYFGGLIGKNTGAIIGCELESVAGGENKIELNGGQTRQNALSSIVINSTLTSGSCIGGVVGFNTYDKISGKIGTIRNGYVQAVINAEKTSNVGGVIGKNEQQGNSLKVTLDENGIQEITDVLNSTYKDKSIYNVKSASTISANNNVGGIVGIDMNGLYIECDYQILPTTNKAISLTGNSYVGGIAGSSNSGKFLYCSVMSYSWNYTNLKTNYDGVITGWADITAVDYVGGIVGATTSTSDPNDLKAGENEVSAKVIVAYSSVNAYIVATERTEDGILTGNIGGILSSEMGIAVLYNVYFIGKLDGAVKYVEATTVDGANVTTHYLCLDNNGSSNYDAVYSINLVTEDGTTTIKSGNIKDKQSFVIDSNPNYDYWWWNANINGGYIFVTKDKDANENSLPIFDLSPDSIKVQANNVKAPGLEKVLVLDYYDFSMNGLDTVTLSELNEKYNRNKYIYKLELNKDTNTYDNVGEINIEVDPENIGTVVLNVMSTKPSVVDVTFDGRLLINGIGECELVFSSALNPNAGVLTDRTIKVVVDYPMGENFRLTTSKNDISQVVQETEKISKDSSKQFYTVTSGKVEITNEDTTTSTYSYRTKFNLNLKVQVEYVTIDKDFDISQYVMISGIKVGTPGYDEERGVRTYLVDLDHKTPFSISVLKCLEESEYFTITVKPYSVISKIEIEYDAGSSFNLSTLKGATSVSFSYEDAIVYPNDIVYVTTYIETDAPVCSNLKVVYYTDDTYTTESDKATEYSKTEYFVDVVKLQELIDYLINKPNESKEGLLLNITNNFNVLFNIYINASTYDQEKQMQTISFRIEFGEIDFAKIKAKELPLFIELETDYGTSAKVEYTILPQRINKIDIKNFYYKNVEENGVITKVRVQEAILKPSTAGEIVLDIAPSNGYYSYLEISDITGNEEILFIQVDENGDAISVKDDPSSDGKGIKLYPQIDSSRIYIRTQISNLYSSKLHTIEVRAYSSDGTQLGNPFTKEIDVKMLPEIVAEQILPSGEVGDTVKILGHKMFQASHVDSRFRITTKNSNSDLMHELLLDGKLTKDFELVKDVGNNYILRQVNTIDYIGKTLTLTLRTYSYMDNGDFDMAEISIDFEIVSFVIHSVSVSNSIKNLTTKEIYGYFDKGIDLDFYFDEDDISYYDTETQGDPFWDTVYKWDSSINLNAITNSDLKQIYSVLQELNSYDKLTNIEDGDNVVPNSHYGVNDYLILNDNSKDNDTYTYNGEPNNINLLENRLEVTGENYSPKYLAVAFKMHLDATNEWKIETYNTAVTSDNYIVDVNYYLNFKKATPWYEPTVIKTPEEFKAMESGGRYILATDIVLTNYTPINADIVEFDGNGRTITIQSFGYFNEESIQAGLFAQVYSNMIVKNVVVKYQSINPEGDWTLGNVDGNGITYMDLCNNEDVSYTEARFGGVAAVNYGIITNCTVSGTIAINASIIEQKKFTSGENYAINFFIGGLVADNDIDEEGNIGYITNSTSELNIFAQANIGGFAYSNAGKIASCAVEENTTIYAYNTNLEKTIVVDVSGFVVNNSGEISMSYVNLAKSDTISYLDGSIYKGTISAKDISAGFVLINSGEIYDAYVQMTETGINNNTFSGFVYDNGGTVVRAYTYINSGNIISSDDNMFAPAGTVGLTNCIEFVVPKTGYSSGVNVGLITHDTGLRYNKTYYQEQNFAFGDNESAVWSISSSALPKLVSTMEKIVYTANKPIDGYDGLLPFFKETEVVDGVKITTYTPNFAYYGTKENPYIIHDVRDYNTYDKDNNLIGVYKSSWTSYFTNNTTAYYRIVKDLDFSEVGDNPITSTMTFSGNIQGNNMVISNIMLYSSSSLESLGLFKSLLGTNDTNVKNAVRNLTLTTSSVWASKTETVGLLAGIVENYNLYNINIDAENVIMVGGNAVGGVAGVVRGEFDIDQISSNIGANSTRASTLNNYSIYISQNNKEDVSYNLSNVYYAGSVFGILDGYNRTPLNINERDISKKYYKVNNVNVSGSITVVGDTVGGAFGFVGEQVYVSNVNIIISGDLFGSQYSAGVAGENRGVIDCVDVVIADEAFTQSKYVSSGIVGLNLGGLIRNVSVKANINKTSYAQTVGGVVGRNVYGTITNVYVDSELFGYFTGGFIGADYTAEILLKATTGSGAINSDCKLNKNLIPTKQVEYKEKGVDIVNYTNLTLSKSALNYMINNLGKYYTYQNNDNSTELSGKTVAYRVLGLIVGLSYNDTLIKNIDVTTETGDTTNVTTNYNVVVNKDEIIFNSEITSVKYDVKAKKFQFYNGSTLIETISSEEYSIPLISSIDDCVLREDELDSSTNVKHDFTDANVLNLSLSNNYVMYIVGSKVGSFDSWERNYTSEYLVIT